MMASQDYFSKYWLWGVGGLLLVLNTLWIVRVSGTQGSAAEGGPAPAFELPRLPAEGGAADAPTGPISLASLRGKVVVLDFWASWCGPCRDGMPALASLDRRFRDRGLAVVGVLTDDPELDVAARMADELGVRYPLVIDADGVVSQRYGVQNLPTAVFIDRAGVIRATEVGPRPPGELARIVEPLLRP